MGQAAITKFYFHNSIYKRILTCRSRYFETMCMWDILFLIVPGFFHMFYRYQLALSVLRSCFLKHKLMLSANFLIAYLIAQVNCPILQNIHQLGLLMDLKALFGSPCPLLCILILSIFLLSAWALLFLVLQTTYFHNWKSCCVQQLKELPLSTSLKMLC